jgi:hypothetical protein
VSARAESGTSRRGLLARIAAAGPAPSESDVIAYLLQLELLAIGLYRLALDSGVLTPRAGGLATALLRQERAHADALAVRLLGREGAAEGVTELTQPQIQAAMIAAGIKIELTKIRTQNDWFWLLERLEHGLEGAYVVALSELQTPAVITLAATILGSESQHATLLNYQHNPLSPHGAVPTGIVNGSPPPPEPRPLPQPSG